MNCDLIVVGGGPGGSMAAKTAALAGLKVVMDKCVKMEHGRYHGGLHSAGMNTEILSARRSRLPGEKE